MSLYPSLEDMQVDHMVQVSILTIRIPEKTKLNLIFLVYFSGPDQSSWSNKTPRYRQCRPSHVPRPGWLHGPWAYPRRYTSKHAGILGTESYDSYDSPSFCAGNLQCSPNGNWQMHFAGFVQLTANVQLNCNWRPKLCLTYRIFSVKIHFWCFLDLLNFRFWIFFAVNFQSCEN